METFIAEVITINDRYLHWQLLDLCWKFA